MSDWWDHTPWRLIQTNLREIDMVDIDAGQVVADLQAFKANVLMINAAGIIASYPTDLPFHFQSPFLQGDSLAQIIEACHDAEIRVFARTDFSKVRRPIYEMHPEWAYISPQGEIVDYNGDVAVCINGDYQQIYALQIIEELLSRLEFDGIFFNMGGYQTKDYSGNYYGLCHCQNCQRRFEEMYDLPLPAGGNLEDPVYRQYVQFQKQTIRAHHEKVYTFLHSRWPHLCIANHREFHHGFIRQESNTAINRPLPHWQYSGSDNTKWAVNNYPQMMSSNTSVDFIDFPYRHVAVSPHQQQLRLAQGLANGGAIDYYLIGRLDNHEDRSGFAGIKQIYHYHAAHEADYAGIRSKATIALVNGPFANQGEFRGWFRFLVENHFLFDTLLEETALTQSWSQYQAVILPDFQAVSDALAERIDRFVENGGVLIGVGRSGFRDETYAPRAQPALKSLGIERVNRVRTEMRSSYFKLADKQGFPRFADTDLLYLDGPYIYAEYVDDARQRLKLIPPHNFGPPERCYYEIVTGHPGFVERAVGQGQAIYLPWLPGSLFHRQGYPNTADFAADLLAHVAGIEPVGGDLSPMVEVTHFANDEADYELVHLVNGSGHFGVSFFAPVPMPDVTVSVPYKSEPRTVESLVREEACDYSWQDGVLTVRVPRLGLFEAIRIA